MRNYVIITCEHGGNRIPAPFRHLFRDRDAVLQSHRGYDPGALLMAEALARALSAPLIASTTSRLLVDLNRSIGNPTLHGEMIRKLPVAARAKIIDRYYLPYRNSVEDRVHEAICAGRRVIHISSHSFTPKLFGKVRNADIGLLYDPARCGELELAAHWKAELAAQSGRFVIRRNFPYQGKGDGLTRTLRRRFEPSSYVGIELELNQKYSGLPHATWRAQRSAIVAALRRALGLFSS